MSSPSEDQIEQRFSELLAKTLGQHVSLQVFRRRDKSGPDFFIQAGSHRFVIECKFSGAAGPVATAIEQLRKYTADSPELIPVVAVPYMGEVGRHLCEQAGMNLIDLSGNAHLSAPGLLIHVEGCPNLFTAAGRPSDVFAPKSSRITRWLLANSHSAWSIPGLERSTNLSPATPADEEHGIRELASSTDMDPGLTSRVIGRLEANGLIQGLRPKSGGRLAAVRATNPGLLLDAWRAEYKFFRHDVLEGHIPARSSEELLRDLDERFKKAGIEHAATGLGAAWLFTHFAEFRLVTFYVRERPEAFLRDIGFRADPRGANVWLVVPNDEGVFQQTRTPRNYDVRARNNHIRCVHPVQVYIDLKDHPERAGDAAAELRKRLLGW
jgi:DNA-binding MarR family transcriptional regulator